MKTTRFLYFILLAVLLIGCAQPTQTATAPAPTLAVQENPVLLSGVTWPGKDWPTSEPDQQGLDAGKLETMLARVDEEGLSVDSVLVIRHGYLVLEYYAKGYGPTNEHILYSVTKSITATLIGIAIDKGLIEGVSQLLSDFLPVDGSANPDPRKSGLILEDLLTMQAGLDWNEGNPEYREMYSQADWAAYMLDKPIVEDPGTTFNYCSGCSHLLSAVLSQAVDGDVTAFARENLFAPLGITRVSWEEDPQGIPVGGWGVYLTPRDMARLGYLYLHQGLWNDQQVVSSEWVAAATQSHADPDDQKEYGYQWWVYPDLKAYAALGLGGQTIFVAPEQDLVVVFTALDVDHDKLIELIESYILEPESYN
ncbi:MAG: class C beta-lactamase-related serine hydrolase [Chloroflexota bacterium]|nr:MAG: class C beta-lactamase-related serine hydrolase [Chloroflexota bacterium]